MVKLRPVHSDLVAQATPLLVVPVFRDVETLSPTGSAVDRLLEGGLTRARESGDLTGREGESLLLPVAGSGGVSPAREAGGAGERPTRVLFVGVGSVGDFDAEGVRAFAGRAVRAAEERGLARLALALDLAGEDGSGDTALDRVDPETAARAAAEGAVLAAWRFRELKTTTDDGTGREIVPIEEVVVGALEDRQALEAGLRIGGAQAKGENLARTLQQRPGNLATPSHLAAEAESLARVTGMSVRILGPAEMEEERMGALLAVAQGSSQEPRLIVLEHAGGDEGDPPLVLVGKGLTFDAGGISIKPAKGMEEMKFDMSGGAAILGAMQAIAELDLPVNVVGVVPSSENLLGESALKPGDVVRTREGKTVEVVNTDAEGRLILADALSFARTFDPAAIVDCATLTGACVVALGHRAAAVLGNDEALVDEVRAAGDRSGERCWPLPLWPVYRKQLDSETADFRNVGGRPAGAITAACFLQEFVGNAKWAHLDVAGVAYGDDPPPYLRKGGFGAPTRLLVEWVRSRTG